MGSKIALVTGAGKRLGAAMALALAEDGYKVWVHFNQSAAEAGRIVEQIRSFGGNAEAVQFDLAAVDTLATLVRGLGQIDVLINSASVFDYDSADRLDSADMQRILNINLVAPALLASVIAERHTTRNSGNVINLLDQKLFNLNPDHFSYTLAKAGLHTATETMAMQFAPRVRVNAIAPGLTLPAPGMSDEEFARWHTDNPMQGGTSPEDIVRTMRFILASPAMTGETILMDSGEHLMRRGRDVSQGG
ncbi:SDR family NAD(P)-dependent oxidoreductase [Hyphobacterium sp. HN65]|uniref:SDR family NAD(P)-dependent oxidoreductase n=1 Tax=Hyphobacterium lacteum TaxID=3116575 RepID=A0ABU7LR97_9PROT|nr:SDR family NAD(P)-dependent oxidoreductase [Hyphobacterium sp. HN65]MEE2526433.1 SDR family NAD(P)-dependent oxidoreductase [Hyphobacterium sp. HN65]